LLFDHSALPQAGSQEKNTGHCAESRAVVTGACDEGNGTIMRDI